MKSITTAWGATGKGGLALVIAFLAAACSTPAGRPSETPEPNDDPPPTTADAAPAKSDARGRLDAPPAAEMADASAAPAPDSAPPADTGSADDAPGADSALAPDAAPGTSPTDVAAVAGVPNIIFDTDLAPDCDDAGALAILHKLADAGEANILAVITSNNVKDSIGTADVINTYYGRPDIPLASFKGDVSVPGTKQYTSRVVAEFPSDVKTHSQVPTADALYRQILAKQPDGSVTIVSVGFLTNVSNLLKTRPDEHSDLDGVALVKKKVKQWVAMASLFPNGREYNMYAGDSAKYSSHAVPNWPTPIVFSGGEIGRQVLTGAGLRATPQTNPVRRIYEIWTNLGSRPSWDQTAVLYAVRGEQNLWTTVGPGTNQVAGDGSNTYRTGDGAHYHLRMKVPAGDIAKIIEGLMVSPPKK